MNPVVGLDVAKGESQVQAFLDKSKPFGKSYSMKHTKEELDLFISFLKEIEGMTGQIAYGHFRIYRTLSFFCYSILGGS